MALYGLSGLSASHLLAWESATAGYVEDFYNTDSAEDVVQNSVSDVSAEFDVTSLNLSGGRRIMLRARRRRNAMESAFLLTYTQTVNYSAKGDISLEEVLQHPFQTPGRRADYVTYLQATDPELFGDITSVSAVFLPEPLEAKSTDSNLDIFAGTVISPASPTAPSAPSPASLKDFYCHNSGEACPSGECPDSDLCMFVPNGIAPMIGPFSGTNSAPSADSAANIMSLALGGDIRPSSPAPFIASNPQPQPRPSPQPQYQPHPTPIIAQSVSSAHGTPPIASKTYGPIEVSGLQMTLHGISLRSAKEVSDKWQHMKCFYLQFLT